jgi:hypothetical protein
MYRILALLLILSVVLIGCAAEPTPTPTAEPPTAVPATEAPSDTPEPTATEMATVAPTNTTAPTATPTPITGTVKSTLNVREQPTTRAKLLGVLKTNDVVTIVGRTDDKSWLQINYPLGDTTTAWVIAERIATTANLDQLPSIAAASPTAAATQVAAQPTASAAATTTVKATVAATTEATTTTKAQATTVAPTAETTQTVEATPVEPTAPAQETAQPPATGGTPPGSIIFDSYENGGFNIYRVRADGTGLQQLIAGGSEPALSPDGSRIAYRMRRDVGGLGIGIASVTGQFEIKVTEESAAGYPTWSPDGNNLAYNVVPSNRLTSQILRIGVGPDNTPTIVADGWRPAWQPAPGTSILYDGCKAGADCGSVLTINAFDGDPNNPNIVTTGSAGAWSPSGRQIAFQAPDDKGNTQIWIINADGSGRTQVTTDIGTHGMPIWSSDGQWLFYRTDQGGAGWAIYAIRTNGTDARKIVDSNVHPDLWVYAKLAIAP